MVPDLWSPRNCDLPVALRVYTDVDILSWVLREHRAGCRFRPPSCPFVEPAALLLARSQTCSLRKSDQILASSWCGRRCSVAQASSDHPRWCRPHPVCLWFTLALGRGSHPRQKSIFAAIFAGFFRHSPCCTMRHSPCCTLFLTNCFGTQIVLCDLHLKRFDLTRSLLFGTFLITVWHKLWRCDHSVLKLESFSPAMNW